MNRDTQPLAEVEQLHIKRPPTQATKSSWTCPEDWAVPNYRALLIFLSKMTLICWMSQHGHSKCWCIDLTPSQCIFVNFQNVEKRRTKAKPGCGEESNTFATACWEITCELQLVWTAWSHTAKRSNNHQFPSVNCDVQNPSWTFLRFLTSFYKIPHVLSVLSFV